MPDGDGTVVVREWKLGIRLAVFPILLMILFVDLYFTYSCVTGRDGGVPLIDLILVLAFSGAFVYLLSRVLLARIVLTNQSIRFRNFGDWVEVRLLDVESVEIQRGGLRVNLLDGSSRVAYALQRSSFSSRSEDEYILDHAINMAKKILS